MSNFSIRAGVPSTWRSLQEMTRASYEEAATQIAALIEERKKKGVPLDDLVDWRDDVGDVLDGISGNTDREAVIDALTKALGIARGGLRPLPPYEDEPLLDGLEVRLRALSRADVLDHRTEMAKLGNVAAAHRASRPLVARVLAGVRGLRDMSGAVHVVDDLTEDDARMPELLGFLDEAGLLGAVYRACLAWQDLSVPQRELYGLPRPSSSVTSTAAPVPPPGAVSSAATAELLAPSSATTTSGELTAAHVVTSSTTHGSEMPLLSTAPSEESRV